MELSDVSFQRMLIVFWVTYARLSMGKQFPEGPREPLTREEITFVERKKELEELFGRDVPVDDCFYMANKLGEASVVKYEELLSEKWLPFHLVTNEFIEAVARIQAMLKNVEVNGTYIVISPGIAMPHARPEEGALDIGLSIVTLKEPVVFGHPKNDPVKIVVGLCAIDHQSHLKALTELADILMDEKKVERITSAETAEDILEIIRRNHYDKNSYRMRCRSRKFHDAF